MGIDNICTWYQHKIGTYDKQKWETKIEQREQRIYGLNHIQTRSATPNTDLIDLDLVRGSSFTKAKPKHGVIKVTKLATLRCLLFPFYGKWWITQTSKYVFGISLLLYISLVINTIIYLINNSTTSTVNSESLSCMEIIIPLIMMWVLSWIHSQIVATASSSEIKKPRMRHRSYKRRNNLKKRHKVEDPDVLRSKKEKVSNKIEKELFNHIELLDSTSNKTIKKSNKSNVNITFGKNEIIGSEGHLEDTLNASCSTDSESETKRVLKPKKKTSLVSRSKTHIPIINITSQDSNCDSEDEPLSSPDIRLNGPSLGDLTSSATEWIGVTTNSEDGSYSSDMDNLSESNIENDRDYPDNDLAPTAILSPPSAKVSCIIWEKNELKKADLSMLEISSAIIGKVDLMPESRDYFYVGLTISTILAFLPVICKILNNSQFSLLETQHVIEHFFINSFEALQKNNLLLLVSHQNNSEEIFIRWRSLFSELEKDSWEYVVMTISLAQRWILASMIFFLLAVAERTFKQRLLYAKLFSHLTSSRRAKKSEIPHFRLNKVINIKTWLSVRSYMKKRGPQRSVDVIVSTAFIANLLLLTFFCVEVLKDTIIFSLYYLEALIWCIGLGIFLLRFMTLGTKINKKYRNLSVLITEQINLHLQIEHKPHKKEEMNIANNVLKLAIDLLKELENPFKISGLSANPILYNCTKLVILSALSGVLSEMLGFKLKLHKIKLK
ncbi:unnamed protein product [Phaedon cochleariae]|uniref:PHTF1/2 N-terminal domain-containing protein n=1 Tax=Phaedon cochleariae TaxID=80249 RepID=A0A9P0DYC8_PHACE|nr:unnamed protein product [Phaedon cochleariae]